MVRRPHRRRDEAGRAGEGRRRSGVVKDSQDQPPDPAYTLDDLRQFAGIIGFSNLSPECAKRLQSAALAYWFLAETDKMHATRSQYRKAMRRITKTARDLKAALGSRAAMLIDDRGALPAIDANVLDNLAEIAEEVANRIPKGGPNPRHARKVFVAELGRIYLAATGERPTFSRPTFSRRLTGESSGRFFEFVEAALRPLNRHALSGLEHDVRAVVNSMAKTPT